jgi:hypothetical protein
LDEWIFKTCNETIKIDNDNNNGSLNKNTKNEAVVDLSPVFLNSDCS